MQRRKNSIINKVNGQFQAGLPIFNLNSHFLSCSFLVNLISIRIEEGSVCRMNQQEIGIFISDCRKQKRLTQAQLAEIIGVSDKSISRWENGKTMPDLSFYEPLCEALDIQVSELLYAKKMTDQEKTIQGEKTALNIFKTKSKLQTFGILTEILIVVGIIITITLTKLLADTTSEMILTTICGCFVWGFGLILRVKIRKAIMEIDNR